MIYTFQDCHLDTGRLELSRGGVVRPLEPQVLRLLAYLIENRHRVVSRNELFAAIWDGRVVAESALYSRIKSARAAIGDEGQAQAQIRTVSRTGYRFVAPVRESGSSTVSTPLNPCSAPARSDVQHVVASADTLDDVELTLPSRPSVAILPFLSTDGDPGHRMIADGLADDMITRIGRGKWLFVVGRGTTFRFRAGPYDVREIGRVLGVRYVVQGSVQVAGGRIKVAASLADATDGRELWADYFHRSLDDIFEIQDELAAVVVGSVEAEIEAAERDRAALAPAGNLDAWTAYHRGCWHMYRFTPADFDQAEHFFRRSMQLEPRAPRAYAGLSFVHWQRGFLELTSDREAEIGKALELAQQSLALDPRDALARWASGRAWLLRGDLDQAVDELEISVSLNPSSAAAQYSLAWALCHGSELSRSIDIVGIARRLSPYDPLTYAMYACRAQSLAFLGQHDESATFATRAARQSNAHYQVTAIASFCNILAGRADVAHEHYRRLQAIRPGYTAVDYLRAFHHRPPESVAMVERAFRQLESL